MIKYKRHYRLKKEKRLKIVLLWLVWIRWNTEDLHILQCSAGAACLSLWSLNFSPAASEELGQRVLQLTSDLEFCHKQIKSL